MSEAVRELGPYILRKPFRAQPKVMLAVKISPELKRQMVEATSKGPYSVTIQSLVERGIELALGELNDLWKAVE